MVLLAKAAVQLIPPWLKHLSRAEAPVLGAPDLAQMQRHRLVSGAPAPVRKLLVLEEVSLKDLNAIIISSSSDSLKTNSPNLTQIGR